MGLRNLACLPASMLFGASFVIVLLSRIFLFPRLASAIGVLTLS